jgi:hypothetical protein
LRAVEVDLVDPFRRGDAVFRRMVEQVSAVLPPVVDALCVAAGTRAEPGPAAYALRGEVGPL